MSNFEQIPERKKLSHHILGNARTFIIILILFTVIVVMTTDIRELTISSITDLGLDFFIVLFASYGMYVCCADGGVSAGYSTDIYKASVARFDELKTKIEGSILIEYVPHTPWFGIETPRYASLPFPYRESSHLSPKDQEFQYGLPSVSSPPTFGTTNNVPCSLLQTRSTYRAY